MKNGLLRFYLMFMFISLAVFSCENNEISKHSGSSENIFQNRPESRHPVEPNEVPAEPKENGKKSRRNYNARSSNWC